MKNASNPQRNAETGNNLVSIVVPVFNEAEVLDAFYHRLKKVLDTLTVLSEIVFVDDGSTDNSHALLIGLQQSDERIAVVALSRNFGKEIAMTDKTLPDLKTFIENVNKKGELHNGRRVRFGFVKRKRKNPKNPA